MDDASEVEVELATPPDSSPEAKALVSTDRIYFGLGARASTRSGLELLYMPKYASSPSGSVIWGLGAASTPSTLGSSLDEAERELATLGGRRLRVYVCDPVPPPVARTFAQRGYRSRRELAVLAPMARAMAVVDDADLGSLRFQEVLTEEHWARKLQLHSASPGQADGYDAVAEQWVGIERTKCGTGKMRCFLVIRDRKPVAAVGLMGRDGVARLKNLFVHPGARRSGLGLATVLLLVQKAASLGYRYFGTFALETGNALSVYRRAGLEPAASVTEFSCELTNQRPGRAGTDGPQI